MTPFDGGSMNEPTLEQVAAVVARFANGTLGGKRDNRGHA
jgi:hypothetical protein